MPAYLMQVYAKNTFYVLLGATFEISTKELQEKLEWHREQLEKGMSYCTIN